MSEFQAMVWSELAGNFHLRTQLRENLPAWRLELARLMTLVHEEGTELREREETADRAEKERIRQARKEMAPRRRLIEGRLREVKAMMAEAGQYAPSSPGSRRNALIAAIERHREATYAGSFEPEPHDLALWAQLDFDSDEARASMAETEVA